jgi:hypothetical protein
MLIANPTNRIHEIRELLHQLEVEEMAHREYDSTFGRFERQLEQNQKTIHEKDQYISELLKRLEELSK